MFYIADKVFNEDGYIEHNPFPVVFHGNTPSTWNLHHINLDKMPLVNAKCPVVSNWLYKHISSQQSVMEEAHKARFRNHPACQLLSFPKDSISCLLYRSITSRGVLDSSGQPFRAWTLASTTAVRAFRGRRAADTVLFLAGVRYDLGAHTVVGDAYVFTSPPLEEGGDALFVRLFGPLLEARTLGGMPLCASELSTWKRMLPALAERCRTSWTHGPQCAYGAPGARVPLHDELHAGDPLCACGRGKDVEGMVRVKEWAHIAPYVTRIAVSPLWPVWGLEPLLWKLVHVTGFADKESKAAEAPPMPVLAGATPVPCCRTCARTEKSLKSCGRCKGTVYCSPKCQKADWKRHKAECKTSPT